MILEKAIIDLQGNDKVCHAFSYAGDGNASNDTDNSLTAFGAQIACCNEKFKAHGKLLTVSPLLAANQEFRRARIVITIKNSYHNHVLTVCCAPVLHIWIVSRGVTALPRNQRC